MPYNRCVNSTVIASAAKQSRGHSTRPLDCFVARAPRNDGQWQYSRSPSRLSYFWASPKRPFGQGKAQAEAARVARKRLSLAKLRPRKGSAIRASAPNIAAILQLNFAPANPLKCQRRNSCAKILIYAPRETRLFSTN